MCAGIGEGVTELQPHVCAHMFCTRIHVRPRATNAESLGREHVLKGHACSPGGCG